MALTEMNKSETNTCIAFFWDTKRLEWYIICILVYTPSHYIRMKSFYQHNGDTLKSRKPQYDYPYVGCITGVCTTKKRKTPIFCNTAAEELVHVSIKCDIK